MKKPIKIIDNTSWDKVADWYGKSVGCSGHFYHQKVILPNIIRQLKINRDDRILDVGCGQGILGRHIPKDVAYLGVDLSAKLIAEARSGDQANKHEYQVGDATKPLQIGKTFNKAVMILSLQNMKQPFLVVKNVAEKLKDRGQFFLVLNHPCFRIPQNSDWGFDYQKQAQYRKVYRYYQPLKIDIKASPFDKVNADSTTSFHYPLSTYVEMLVENGLVLIGMEEWISPKISQGGRAKEENEARRQIPMFMLLVAQKL